VIDEGVFDPLPQRIGKGVLRGIKIAGPQLLNGCGNLCFDRRRQSLLRGRPHSGREKKQQQDAKGSLLG